MDVDGTRRTNLSTRDPIKEGFPIHFHISSFLTRSPYLSHCQGFAPPKDALRNVRHGEGGANWGHGLAPPRGAARGVKHNEVAGAGQPRDTP